MIGEKCMLENNMREVIRQAPFGYAYHKMLFDLQGKAVDYIFIDVNNAFEKMTGLDSDKIIGKKITEVIPNIGDDAFDWIEFYGDVIANNQKQEFTRYAEDFGRWFKITAFPLDKGHFATLFHDVSSEMEQIEILNKQKEDLAKLSKEFELIFNSTQDSMFLVSVKDGAFRYIRTNKTNQLLTGIPLHNIKDRTPVEVLGITGKVLEENYQRCVDAKSTISYEEVVELPGGKRIWNTNLIPIFEKGEIVYIVGSSQDITLQRTAEIENENYLKRFQDMYNGHTTAMLLVEPFTGEIIDANPAALSFYGYTKDEICNLHTEDINMLSKEEIKKRRVEALHREQKYNLFSHRLKNGEIRLVDVHACPIEIDGESVLYAIIFDVTDREKYKEELLREKEFLRITLQSIGDCVIITDQLGRISFINNVAERLTGWKNKEVIGRQFPEILKILNEDTKIEIEDPVSKVLQKRSGISNSNHLVLLDKDGKEIFISKTASPIIDENNNIFGVVVVLRDVSLEKKHHEEIVYLSYHDYLTGLYNRRFMEEEIKRYDNSRQVPIAIIMGDINGLKITNDVFGHEAGDRLLQKVAETIRENCRSEDIIARWGGDEFLILLPNTTNEIAKEIVSRIRLCCSTKKEGNIKLSISLGYAVKTCADEKIQKIINEAEEWMYHKKLMDGKSYRSAIINTLMSTLYEKSTETKEHSDRLKNNCNLLGKAMKLSTSELDELTLLTLLHDIGKVGIRESVLKKSGPLTQEEWSEIKKHPEIGFRIVQNIPELASVSEFILHHHERWDGKGYPSGLIGREIPLMSRILAVVDAYDAMISDRIYKKAISKEEAITELKRNAGTQFDAKIVEIFINICDC